MLLSLGVRLDRPAQEVRARWASNASRFVDIDGTQVHYRDEGQGEAVVLLHGASSSLHTWDAWVAHLSGRYRVVRLDLPGFGLTGADGSHDYSMDHYARFLEKFYARIGIDRAHIAGNSYGGHIAWSFAVAHPERVRSLVLVDAAGYPKRMAPMLQLTRMPVISSLSRWITPELAVRKTLRDIYFDDSKVTDALVNRHHEMLLREGNRESFTERMKTDFPDETSGLRALRMPALILWGAIDPWIPFEHAHRFHRDLAGSELIIYPNAGHVPMEELGEQTAADVSRFFAAHAEP